MRNFKIRILSKMLAISIIGAVENCPNIIIGFMQTVLNTNSLAELNTNRSGARDLNHLMLNSYESVWHAWFDCKPTAASKEEKASMEAKQECVIKVQLCTSWNESIPGFHQLGKKEEEEKKKKI